MRIHIELKELLFLAIQGGIHLYSYWKFEVSLGYQSQKKKKKKTTTEQPNQPNKQVWK